MHPTGRPCIGINNSLKSWEDILISEGVYTIVVSFKNLHPLLKWRIFRVIHFCYNCIVIFFTKYESNDGKSQSHIYKRNLNYTSFHVICWKLPYFTLNLATYRLHIIYIFMYLFCQVFSIGRDAITLMPFRYQNVLG